MGVTAYTIRNIPTQIFSVKTSGGNTSKTLRESDRVPIVLPKEGGTSYHSPAKVSPV